MGLTEEQKGERDLKTLGIPAFDAGGEEDYVFISYKSDDWEIVLDKVVRYMVENYGLKVYFDTNFKRSNDSWIKNMKKAIATGKCRAVLAFVSRKYMVSYACLMELLTARSQWAQLKFIKGNYKELQIIPIIIDDSGSVQGARSRSGKPVHFEEWESKEYVELLKNTKASSWVDEHDELRPWLDLLITDNMELTEESISTMAGIILSGMGVNERVFRKNSLESGFFSDLKEAIEKCSETVFAPNLIKKKTTTPTDADAASKASSGTNSVKKEKTEKTEKTEKKESVSLPRELYPELKIGELVQQVLKQILVEKATAEEIRLMQEAEYSKTTFGITYPLLAKISQPFDRRRYYSEVIEICGEQYHLCSQWFETPANNDRPYVEKWIREHCDLS